MEYFTIANWEEFQHYKDRNPPWIKLHRALLTDYEFACLQDASKLHLVLIWLLFSQSKKALPVDSKYIQKALHLEEEPDLEMLIDKGFLVLDSDSLARRKQSAMPETEAEAEAEAEIGHQGENSIININTIGGIADEIDLETGEVVSWK